LRKTQLINLAKAYEIPVDETLPVTEIVMELEMHESRGVFQGPPKPEMMLHFERAKFNSDSMQEAKANGGYEGTRSQPGRFVTVLGRWNGPLPPEEKAPEIVRLPQEVSNRKNLNEYRALQARAIALGIKAGGRSKEAILKEIAIRQGDASREPETAA
jgi:hypothetical protein